MLSAGVAMASCSEETLSETSVITESVNAQTEFDRWLESNYRAPYNIKFMYRYEDVESDMDYDLVPARELYCRILAKAIRYLWIDPYTENTDVHFMREFSPRVMMIIGSGAYDPINGTIRLGTAEGGLKVTLYVGNWLEDFVRFNFFTMTWLIYVICLTCVGPIMVMVVRTNYKNTSFYLDHIFYYGCNSRLLFISDIRSPTNENIIYELFFSW